MRALLGNIDLRSGKYGPRAVSFLEVVYYNQALENKKYSAYDHFHGINWYGKIPTKKEPIRMLGFTSRQPCRMININSHFFEAHVQ